MFYAMVVYFENDSFCQAKRQSICLAEKSVLRPPIYLLGRKKRFATSALLGRKKRFATSALLGRKKRFGSLLSLAESRNRFVASALIGK